MKTRANALSTLLASHGGTLGLRTFEDPIADGVTSISAATDTNSQHGLIYSTTHTNEVKFQKYNGSSWSTPDTLASAGPSVVLSSLGADDFAAIWQNGANIEFKKYDGTTWDV
jgi:hypothetical protein